MYVNRTKTFKRLFKKIIKKSFKKCFKNENNRINIR